MATTDSRDQHTIRDCEGITLTHAHTADRPTAMTLRCPACRSDSVRRSHARADDGLIRSAFFSRYRCRACHRHFYRLATGPRITIAAVLLIALTVGLGWVLSVLYPPPSSDAEPVVSAPATPPGEQAPESVSPAPLAADSTAALAERGDARSQFLLGMAYRNRQGSGHDPALAYQWLEKAAQQDHVEAQYALGAMHLAGEGVLQSFPKAFEWFERAAQHNHAEAQFNLGQMYRRGYGVATNNVKAYVWFNLAAAQGHARAREARDNLLSLLTQDQVNAAQREAGEWKPNAKRS